MIGYFPDIIEKNGKTIKENNLERKHNIPIGALVEVKYDEWYGEGACRKVHARLFVVRHIRDCDGTPLYVLHRFKTISPYYRDDLVGGINEKELTVIEQTDDIKKGVGALEWEEGE